MCINVIKTKDEICKLLFLDFVVISGSCPELRELEQLIDDRVPLQTITDKMDRLRYSIPFIYQSWVQDLRFH